MLNNSSRHVNCLSMVYHQLCTIWAALTSGNNFFYFPHVCNFDALLLIILQNPRWSRNTADTSSQRQWCHLLSTLEALLQEWIESSVLLFITLWLIVVKWKKACVVPLSSGSRTGSSQSFFNLKWEIVPEDVGKQLKCDQWLGKTNQELEHDAREEALNNVVFWSPSVEGIPWWQLFRFFSHLNKIGGLTVRNW